MTANDTESMPEAPLGLKYLSVDADVSGEKVITGTLTTTADYTPMQWMYADGADANRHVLDWRKAKCDAIIDKMIERQAQLGIETSRQTAVEHQIDIYLARHATTPPRPAYQMMSPTVPPPKPRPDWLQEIIATAARSIFRFG